MGGMKLLTVNELRKLEAEAELIQHCDQLSTEIRHAALEIHIGILRMKKALLTSPDIPEDIGA